MATITEEYVSFETAKLLKEKGFNEPCICYSYGNGMNNYFSKPRIIDGANSDASYILLPTQQMAMKWLREKYNIYISIQPDFPSDKDYKICWCWSASILHENCISTKGFQCYIETYEEATEAAIKYCLEHLI